MTEQVMTDRERTALQLSRAHEALEKVWPMIEAKTTPGPWVASNVDVSTAAELVGNIICEAPEAWEESMCYWKANARLIAAAPDLLEALEDAKATIHELNTMYRATTRAAVLDRIDSAIAKATGEKP